MNTRTVALAGVTLVAVAAMAACGEGEQGGVDGYFARMQKLSDTTAAQYAAVAARPTLSDEDLFDKFALLQDQSNAASEKQEIREEFVGQIEQLRPPPEVLFEHGAFVEYQRGMIETAEGIVHRFDLAIERSESPFSEDLIDDLVMYSAIEKRYNRDLCTPLEEVASKHGIDVDLC